MTEDPSRWLDDPDAPSDIVSDLQQVTADPGPPIAMDAGLAAIKAKLAAEAVAGGAAAATAKGGLSLKLISLVVGGVGLVAVGGYVAVRRDTEPRPAAEQQVAPSEVFEPPEAPGPEETEAVAVPTDRDEPVNWSGRAKRRRAATPADEDVLQREMALLARARAALEGRPRVALSLSDRGHRDFPQGVFYEEREATAIQALSALGREREARRRGETFLRRFPRGTFARRVRRTIGAEQTAADEPSVPQ